jgi:hypothetical protein
MRKTLQKTLAILDGKPTGFRGQSLVELSITMPIFLIMLLGMVEVGWFANNYLILTDVVRSAGRYGSIRDPLQWIPGEEKNYHRLDCDYGAGGAGTFNKLPTELITSPPVTLPGYSISGETQELGYYDGVACAAIANMAPLEFKDDEDDIVVSVFGYVRLPDCGGGQACIRLAGRYPSQVNECGEDSFDPFDVNRNNILDPAFEDPVFFDNPGGVDNEGIRGYIFRGHQLTDDDNSCLGSRISNTQMEEMLDKTLIKTDPEETISQLELESIASYGMVLVEIQYQSYQLLNIPFFTAFGNPIPIHIWGVFPVSAAEPDIDI